MTGNASVPDIGPSRIGAGKLSKQIDTQFQTALNRELRYNPAYRI
jgi:hypothetical protein